MLSYPNPFASQDPEMSSFSPNQEEANSHSSLNPYSFYHLMPSPPPFSPSSFNYDFLFAADAFPADASALPPPDPEAGEETVPAAAPPALRKAASAGGRRKRFRTDRHSKIYTSQGLRDRRMRLSLSVARQFFQLQDMLGFDKASHTIDWLLKQSKPAIDLLGAAGSSRLISSTQTLNSGSFVTESSASECEVASSNSRHKAKPAAAASSSKAKASGAAARSSREVPFDRGLTKESREKARARARERTLEKKRIENSSTCGFVDQLTPTCECSPMNINSSWFNMYSDKNEGNLPDEQKD